MVFEVPLSCCILFDQAVGQMFTDDWSSGVSLNWDNIEPDLDWRFTGFPADSQLELSVLNEKNPINIEGIETAIGVLTLRDKPTFVSSQDFHDGLVQRRRGPPNSISFLSTVA